MSKLGILFIGPQGGGKTTQLRKVADSHYDKSDKTLVLYEANNVKELEENIEAYKDSGEFHLVESNVLHGKPLPQIIYEYFEVRHCDFNRIEEPHYIITNTNN